MTAQPPPPNRYTNQADNFERNLQRIILRQDTTANWEKNNPIPARGELCYTIDGGNVGEKLKVGNGEANWTDIPYLAGRGQSGPPGPPGADGGGVTIVGTIDHCGPPTAEECPNPQVGDLIIVDCDNPSNVPNPDAENLENICSDCDGDAYSYARTQEWISIGNIKGKQGDKGDKGDSATVSVNSTKTGDPGTDALVSNSGSTQNAELDFTIPRGDQGIQGIQGPMGPGGGVGPRGPQGDKGDDGDDGDTPTISLVPAVDVQKDETIVQNRGEFTLTNSDPLNPQYKLDLELIPDSGSDVNLKMCEITDVDCSDYPNEGGQVLVYNTNGDDPVWVPQGAGKAALGGEPIGGWPDGSIGDAIENSGASGNLPISSEDGTVTLDSPAANSFEIKLDSGSSSPGKSRFFIDDESTTILPQGLVGSGDSADDEALTNALRLYTDASKNYVGFGISSATLNIAACKAVANIDVYAKSTKAARFTQAGIFLYSDDVERFRLRGDGTIGIGDSPGGAKSQGIRAIYDDLVIQNWISIYDSTGIPDNTDSDAPVKNAYGHWVQPRSSDVTQSCNYYAFYAPAPVQVGGGLLKTYIGSSVENCTIAKNATSFQSNQNTAAVGTCYAFYANGSAPSRFNGGIQTNTITTSAAADGDASMSLGGKFMYIESGNAVRLTVLDNDIAAFSGYTPQTDDSLVTKKWVTENGGGTTGDYLPLAGGTMDAGVDVVMPSGASVNPNLQVGGLATDSVSASFQIAARGTTNSKNSQIVSWAKEGGSALIKLGLERGATALDTYWNFTHKVTQDVDGNVAVDRVDISNKTGNWLTFKDDQTKSPLTSIMVVSNCTRTNDELNEMAASPSAAFCVVIVFTQNKWFEVIVDFV